MTPKEGRFCGVGLRPLCFLIAYLHLASGVIDVFYHVGTVAVVTNGFQCDASQESLKVVVVPWLDPLLIFLNLGSHGFFPYPRVIHNQYQIDVAEMTTEPRCYPGMLHIYLIDVLYFMINIIWLRIVISYVGGVHKKNPEPMRMFFSMSAVKLVILLMYFGYQPYFYGGWNEETVWILKLVDILIAAIFLIIVQKYTKYLRIKENVDTNVEKPPSYIECLINTATQPPAYQAKDDRELAIVVDDGRKSKEREESPK